MLLVAGVDEELTVQVVNKDGVSMPDVEEVDDEIGGVDERPEDDDSKQPDPDRAYWGSPRTA